MSRAAPNDPPPEDASAIRRLDSREAGFEAAFAALLGSKREDDPAVDAAAGAILEAVRTRGDAALVEHTRRFDRWHATPERLRVAAHEIDAAVAACRPSDLEALDLAARRIEAFHRRERPADALWTDEAGMTLGWRWTPVDAAGLYAPGGAASYPSSVLMTALPAVAAGVERLALCAPTPEGRSNPLVLAAARRAGVSEVYRLGGAQAIGALAYGTETVAPVDVVVGPGNAYVAAAKRRVFGRVGIDSIAGPSEILIIADASADADWLALDLLAQAEHDADAQAIMITDAPALADAVAARLAARLEALPRRAIAAAALAAQGAIVTVRDLVEAAALANRVAAEHLALAVVDPEAMAARIRHAGAIFLGQHTPEAIGDYVGGPNHVLPTARSARHASGLSTLDFLKRSTLARATPAALAAIGPAAATLADAEGLGAHALSVRVRLGAEGGR